MVRPTFAFLLCLSVAEAGVAASGLAAPARKRVEKTTVEGDTKLFEAVFASLRDKAGNKVQLIDKHAKEAKQDLAAIKKHKKKVGVDDTVRVLRDALTGIAKDGGPSAFLATDRDEEYSAWQSTFSGTMEGVRRPQIGVDTKRRGSRWFVTKVYAGSPAEKAGLMAGDEWILSGNKKTPLGEILTLRNGAPLALTLRRHPGGEPFQVSAPVLYESFLELAVRHMESGHHLLQIKNHSVAYVPLPAASQPRFRELLTTLAQRYQTESEAMILDLRNGSLGPDATYFEPFIGPSAVYDKPLIVLVDASTGGGRERLAGLLQKTKRGLLVGAPTLGLREALDLLDPIPGEAALLLAVPSIPQPKEPENTPISPDYTEERLLLYAAGSDPQLTKALRVAEQEIIKNKSSPQRGQL
jgi:C-terminal processing protease CtpA/Prc